MRIPELVGRTVTVVGFSLRRPHRLATSAASANDTTNMHNLTPDEMLLRHVAVAPRVDMSTKEPRRWVNSTGCGPDSIESCNFGDTDAAGVSTSPCISSSTTPSYCHVTHCVPQYLCGQHGVLLCTDCLADASGAAHLCATDP